MWWHFPDLTFKKRTECSCQDQHGSDHAEVKLKSFTGFTLLSVLCSVITNFCCCRLNVIITLLRKRQATKRKHLSLCQTSDEAPPWYHRSWMLLIGLSHYKLLTLRKQIITFSMVKNVLAGMDQNSEHDPLITCRRISTRFCNDASLMIECAWTLISAC